MNQSANAHGPQYSAAASFLKLQSLKIVSLLLGGLCLYLSHYNSSAYEELLSHPPAATRLAVWLTPEATLVSVFSFSPGQPTITTSLKDFKQEVGSGPYQVYLWQGWREGVSLAPDWGDVWFIRYHAETKKGGMKSYLYAYESVPVRMSQDWKWAFATRFDTTKNEFVVEPAKLSSVYWFLGWFWYWVALVTFVSITIRVGWQAFASRPSK